MSVLGLETEMATLYELAKAFREAIKQCDCTQLPVAFERFPFASCGDASLLLAKWLEENRHDGFEYVCGWRNRQSHARLERDGIIIDITADKFPEISESVIVAYDSTWHTTFEENERNPANFEMYDSHTTAMLRAAYAVVRRQTIQILHHIYQTTSNHATISTSESVKKQRFFSQKSMAVETRIEREISEFVLKKSASFTRKKSRVQIQHRPPLKLKNGLYEYVAKAICS